MIGVRFRTIHSDFCIALFAVTWKTVVKVCDFKGCCIFSPRLGT